MRALSISAAASRQAVLAPIETEGVSPTSDNVSGVQQLLKSSLLKSYEQRLNNGGDRCTPQSQQAAVEAVWRRAGERASCQSGPLAEKKPEKVSGVESGPAVLAPDLCITGAMTRQERAGERETGGEDTLEVSVFGGWDRQRFEMLSERLDERRRSAEEGGSGLIEVAGGYSLEVEAAGAKAGVYFRWVAKWGGCRIYLLNRSGASDKTPAVRVTFGSLALMTMGLNECWLRFTQLLQAMGFLMHWHQVSRVDLCVDLPGQPVEPFIEAALSFAYVSKAKRGSPHYAGPHEWEGWSHGTGPVHMRVYDKLREVKQSQDWAKLEALMQKRWGGVVPDCATRVEFQLRRETLRDRWQVSTIEDYKQKRRQILEWLTSDWMRLVSGATKAVRENRNQTRCPTLPLWDRVREAFFAWVGTNAIPVVVARGVLRPSVEAIGKQICGCMTTLAALIGRAPATVDEWMTEAGQVFWLYGREAMRTAADKAARFEAVHGVLLSGHFEGAG